MPSIARTVIILLIALIAAAVIRQTISHHAPRALPFDQEMTITAAGAVEAARSELNKSRTMMLLRMRRVLTPDQRVKFVQLQQQMRDHGRSGGDHKQ